jgi:protein TonB
MADPNERAEDLNPQPLPPKQADKGVSPLIWILLLLAIIAAGWWYYQRGSEQATTPAAPDTTPAITSEQEAAADAERERAEANERRRAGQAREAASAQPADRAVEPIARVQPDYPPEAFRAGEEGTVVLRVDVDAAGNPGNVDIVSRSGSRDLDRAAIEAVRKWKFRPAMQGGQAVASQVEVPIDFRMDRQ